MQIEFVAHSSVVYRRDPVHLICDPWLEGTAFDDGWALLSEPVFKPEDFASITHIWFSHEHPDHFSPRTLGRIPEEIRKKITVMFHESDDKKIVAHCRKLGFGEVVELPLGEWQTLAPGFELLCNTWEQSDDSWLLIRTPEGRVLNLNDCQVTSPAQADALHAETGDVDVLLTQFSISAWDGNREDVARRQAGAEEMIKRTVRQASRLHARHVVPFASFIWFCHEENDYMNECLRGPGEVAARIRDETTAQPVVLYPGDIWEVGAPRDSASSIARYASDLASLPSRPRIQSKPVDLETLQQAAEKFRATLNAGLSPFRVYLREIRQSAATAKRRRIGSPLKARIAWLQQLATLRPLPARIWLTDQAHAVEFSSIRGLRRVSVQKADCDLEVSSSALFYALRFLWGGESLQINGRFRELYRDGRIALFNHIWMACAMNHEEGASARPL